MVEQTISDFAEGCTRKLLRLEKLTGQKTPGWGEGRLHPDMDAAYKFWEEALR